MCEAVRPVSADQNPAEAPGLPRGLDRLLDLQGIDLTVDRLRARMAGLEAGGEVLAVRKQLEETESRMGEAKLALDGVSRDQRRLEGDVDSMQQKIDAERKRMFDGSVVNPKELQAIGAEVESLQHRKARTEDLVLEQMEQREELEARVSNLEAEAGGARVRVEEIEETSGREHVEIERELADAITRREALAAKVDGELLEQYEDLRRQKKGVGVAALVDGVCQGCHQKLSAVYLDRLKRSPDILRCEYCRRILIFG
jgi:predicted  nucleic acid-binding Zn-ribbon protein